MDEINKVIVIGASAGGLSAISRLIALLPNDKNMAVLVVVHFSKKSAAEVIIKHLQQQTKLVCGVPTDKAPIERGHLYLAPPDHHMMIKKNLIRIHNGPQENRWRPSIDVLFRSAAANYDSHVIGIILSGLMDDGTSGMSAIKRSGGICIVQDPVEAQYADMPNSVLQQVEVDYQVPIADMGYIIEDSLAKQAASPTPIPADVKIEADITERMISGIQDLKEIGSRTDFSCPDCGGGLWKITNDSVHRYRCYTGHVYTENLLYEKQYEGLEESLWVSIRILEERRNLLHIMALHEQEAGHTDQSTQTKNRAEDVNIHIDRLKAVLRAGDKL